jgi:hypothetical protein
MDPNKDNDDDNAEHIDEQQQTKTTGIASPIPTVEAFGAISFIAGAAANNAGNAANNAGGIPPLCPPLFI